MGNISWELLRDKQALIRSAEDADMWHSQRRFLLKAGKRNVRHQFLSGLFNATECQTGA